MKSVSMHEAKTHLSALIAGIERSGDSVIIMKHNNAVAELRPLPRGNRIAMHPEISDIEILYDPTDPTEEEWDEV